MKQYILLNVTYYITKYFNSNPLFKIFFTIILSLSIRQVLDTSALAFCMEESSLDSVPKPKRVTFDPSFEEDPTQPYRTTIMKQRYEIAKQHGHIEHLNREIQQREYRLLEKEVLNTRLVDMLARYESEIKGLRRDLAVAESKLSIFSRTALRLQEQGITFNPLKLFKK